MSLAEEIDKFGEYINSIEIKNNSGNTVSLKDYIRGYGRGTSIESDNKKQVYFINYKKNSFLKEFPKEFNGEKIEYREILESLFTRKGIISKILTKIKPYK